MAYATGIYSVAICDYCGFQYPYQELRKNWKGFMVCPQDYEPKSPQIEPFVVFVGLPGDSGFQSKGSAADTVNMQPFPTQRPVEGVGYVGTVTIVVT